MIAIVPPPRRTISFETFKATFPEFWALFVPRLDQIDPENLKEIGPDEARVIYKFLSRTDVEYRTIDILSWQNSRQDFDPRTLLARVKAACTEIMTDSTDDRCDLESRGYRYYYGHIFQLTSLAKYSFCLYCNKFVYDDSRCLHCSGCPSCYHVSRKRDWCLKCNSYHPTRFLPKKVCPTCGFKAVICKTCNLGCPQCDPTLSPEFKLNACGDCKDCCECAMCGNCGEHPKQGTDICDNCEKASCCCDCEICDRGCRVDSGGVCGNCSCCVDSHCACSVCSSCVENGDENCRYGEDDYCTDCSQCNDHCGCVKCRECGELIDTTEDEELCSHCSRCSDCCHCQYVEPSKDTYWTANYPTDRKLFNSTRLAGAEIEYVSIVNFDPIKACVKRWRGGVVSDVSCGHEVITAPAAGDKLVNQLLETFTALNDGGAKVNVRCSVHVHVDARDLKWVDIRRLALVYSTVEPFLYLLAGQHRSSLCLKQNGHNYSAPNGKALSGAALDIEWKKRLLKTILQCADIPRNKPHKKSESRYVGMNLVPWVAGRVSSRRFTNGTALVGKHYRPKYKTERTTIPDTTIEFRLHRDSLDAERVIGWTKLLVRLVDWCAKATDKEVTDLLNRKESSARALCRIAPDCASWIIKRLRAWRKAVRFGRRRIAYYRGEYMLIRPRDKARMGEFPDYEEAA